MDSREYVEAEPRYEVSAEDRADATKGQVTPSAPTKEEEDRNGDHTRLSRDRSRMETSAADKARSKSSQTPRRCPARTSISRVGI